MTAKAVFFRQFFEEKVWQQQLNGWPGLAADNEWFADCAGTDNRFGGRV